MRRASKPSTVTFSSLPAVRHLREDQDGWHTCKRGGKHTAALFVEVPAAMVIDTVPVCAAAAEAPGPAGPVGREGPEGPGVPGAPVGICSIAEQRSAARANVQVGPCPIVEDEHIAFTPVRQGVTALRDCQFVGHVAGIVFVVVEAINRQHVVAHDQQGRVNGEV